MNWLRRFFRPPPAMDAAPIPVPANDTRPLRISDVALAEIATSGRAPVNPWTIPNPAPGVAPSSIAMDSAPANVSAIYGWAMQGAFSEGLGFLGYPYLAELSQRPEYRRISEIIAEAMTRKWVKVRGKDEERVTALEEAMARFRVREAFRKAAEGDGFFGRAHLFIDVGQRDLPGELETPLVVNSAKIAKGSLKAITPVEAFWCYPSMYNSTDPLASDFYKPSAWYVMGRIVHSTRLLTLVGREMPDMLKPAYQFGGLSLSQMAKPYVDNWLRTRQSVSDLLHSFSIVVLKTNLSVLAQSASQLVNRVLMFNRTRDNRGLMMVDRDTEDLANVSTPLGTLDALQAQAQEQMAAVSGIPLVELLGITPAGLNASSEGELKAYYGRIHDDQEHLFREPLQTVLNVLQLNEFGDIDDSITFEFIHLWEMDEEQKARIILTKAQSDDLYINNGTLAQEEVRERLSEDEEGLYFGVDLSGPAPELPDADNDDGEDGEAEAA